MGPTYYIFSKHLAPLTYTASSFSSVTSSSIISNFFSNSYV